MAADWQMARHRLDQSSAGDQQAFGAFAAAVQDDLFRFALAQGLQSGDAAEATQETLLRIYRARRSWRVGADAAAWTYAIAMNVVRESRRKRRRKAGSPLELSADAVACPCEGPAGLAARNDDTEAMIRRLEALPQRQREVLVCRFLRQMSVSQTSAAMGCAEGTVKAAVFAALANLRKMMNHD